VYSYRSRPIWRCTGCRKQFSVTSGTIFHSRKLPIRDYLAAVAIFANGAKGHAALHLSRDLDCQYKTAFVLAHKLREAMGSEVHNPDLPELSGAVTIDGAYFGGKVKQANRKAERTDRRAAEEQTGKRQVVVVARELLGRTLPFIVPRESAAVPLIRQHVASGTTVHADESGAWDALHASYPMLRVNHSREFQGDNGACTNDAESWFSRLRAANSSTLGTWSLSIPRPSTA
jgi:ISXO2-like transposase domain